MIDVKIIQGQGHSALVEWLEGKRLKRVTIPTKVILDGQVSKYDLELGIPYGLKWSELIKLSASSGQLEQELRRVGVWTAEDALNNAEKVRGAIQAVYSVDLGKIMRVAKKERSE
jgi:hypothetical protein